MLSAEVIEEKIDQQTDVLAPLAQRRNHQLEHAESIIQIFAELLLADVVLQVLVRGGDDPHVDADFLGGPDRQERMPFQNAQQLGLPFEGHFADFVEKQRAQIGLLEIAGMVAVGAGERAGLVAEQLAFHQVGRNGGAVDRTASAGRRAGWRGAAPGRPVPCPSRSRRESARSRWPGPAD